MNRHPKAARTAPTDGRGSRRAASLTLVSLVALLALVFVPSASALFQRPFKETFGSAGQPTFSSPSTLAVDPATGDVLVGDAGTRTIQRFHPDGTPAPFSALGGNSIDGTAGPKPCAEEPSSCDETPGNSGIEIEAQNLTQIAVDHSGGPTDGDIYLSQRFRRLVYIFAPSGTYLGQLTAAGTAPFPTVAGVTVNETGVVYVSSSGEISKFAPTANPVTNTDNTTNFFLPPGIPEGEVRALSLGTGPSSGALFAMNFNNNHLGHIYKINAETGEFEYSVAEDFGGGATTIDPTTGRLIATNQSTEAVEFDVSGESSAVRTGLLVSRHEISGIAASNSGEIYVASPAASPTIDVYGTPGVASTVVAEPAGGITGTKAVLSGTVDPEGLPVTECVFEYGEGTGYGETAPCEGAIPTDSEPHPVQLRISGLEPNGHTYHFRVAATNENGTEYSADRSFVTANTVETEAAAPIGRTGATLNGTMRPEGEAFSACYFEYGLDSAATLEGKAPCDPPAGAIEGDFNPHAVSAPLTGLQQDTTYRYRLVATDAEGTHRGDDMTFTTLGPPVIGEVRARDATQSSVTVEGKINPSGFGTSYRFEWGPTASYGRQAPAEFEPNIGSGTEAILVNAKLTGLSKGTTYHYRVVATSSAGTIASPDQTLETVNSCGLPEGRCFELVSRREVGPVAIPGESVSGAEMHFQAATGGTGALAYPVEAGYPEATRGAEVLYRGTRGPGGWQSTQLSTPIVGLNERTEGGSAGGQVLWLSSNLYCGFAESTQPLTEDPSMRLVLESGGTNLYRVNPDNSYTPASFLAPENPEGLLGKANYSVVGASQDCHKVVFTSHLFYPGIPVYPGIPGSGENHTYEWEEGTLRNVGVVPGPSGEVVVGATSNADGNTVNPVVANADGNTLNPVSEDGSRVFFTANRETSSNPAEIGTQGVFVREDGTTTRDLSLSETSTPDKGANYEWASPDGSRVFFTANAGLTDESSLEGTDLYMYDLEREQLTDLTPYRGEGGAQVGGFVGAAEDGSHVYFLARNQLVPGKGSTLAKNQRANTYSIYGESDGQISFVGAITAADFSVVTGTSRTSQVSPDGRYLVFESLGDVTGYRSGGSYEAYLYDAEGGSEGTICVSCRPDGQPSVAHGSVGGRGPYQVLPSYQQLFSPHPAQVLISHGDTVQVFFSSPDTLSRGAVEGQNNVYEWSHGQVFRLASADAGQQAEALSGYFAGFVGASADGSDVYLYTPETLNWEDGDERVSVYDARVGGGFPEPPPPLPACDATAEGSCQGSAQTGPVVPGAASASFSGPGNPTPAGGKQKKHAKKKHAKKKHAKKKHKRDPKRARQANVNRRAGK